MNFAKLAIAVAILSRCAHVPVIQASYPATMEVDFGEIPITRCDPPLDGLFVSHAGALDLVRGMRKVEHDYQVQAIHQESATRICETKLEASERELKEQSGERAWALIGKISVGTVGVGVVVGAIVVIANAFGVKK